jgi:hypothetical protein
VSAPAGALPDAVTAEPASVSTSCGWSLVEPVGTWSDGTKAALRLRALKPTETYECSMDIRPHVFPPQLTEQRVTIALGERIVFQDSLVAPRTVRFTIAAGLADPSGELSVILRLPDAISPRELGSGTDERKLGILLHRISVAKTQVSAVSHRDASSTDVILVQTADAMVYKDMLDLTAIPNIVYCRRHNLRYESFFGIKKGVVPWMATYNRIILLQELLDRGFRGWVAYLDADAYVIDFEFDLRSYLNDNAGYCLLISPGGGSDTPWDVNAGVFFVNLGDSGGRAFVEDWAARFKDMVPDEYLADPAAKWDEYPNDQTILYECLQHCGDLLKKTKIERSDLFNYTNGRFIRQAIRAGFNDLRSRTDWIRTDTRKHLAHFAPAYTDLTALAIRFGLQESGADAEEPSTLFYQFLFDEFVTDTFDYLLLGPDDGNSGLGAVPGGQAAAWVRMWLTYLPRAFCHHVDVHKTPQFQHERLRSYECDFGSVADIAALCGALPAMRMVLDDACRSAHDQQAAFTALFPILGSGGYYLIRHTGGQSEAEDPSAPPCRLTRDIFMEFTRTRHLDLGAVGFAQRQILSRQIGRVHFQRRPADGLPTMIAIQKL